MRDQIRSFEEVLESYRRRKVLNGEWSEKDSRKNLKAQLKAYKEEYPTPKDEQRALRQFW